MICSVRAMLLDIYCVHGLCCSIYTLLHILALQAVHNMLYYTKRFGARTATFK